MKTKRITRTLLRKYGACYSDEYITELVPEGGVTLQQVLETDRIPHEDKIWVVTRKNLLPETIMAAWLAGIVEHTPRRLENTDPRHVAVVSLLRRIAAGEEVSQEERDQIRNEARHAANWAAYYAPHAASSAASFAASYAAWAAAWSAASSAAQGDAERKQQVQDLLALLED